MNLIVSFHIADAKSTTASSRRTSDSLSRCAGVQHSRSHSSSTGADAEDLAHLGHGEVQVGEPLDAVEDGLRDVVGVRELVGPQGDRTRKQPDRSR